MRVERLVGKATREDFAHVVRRAAEHSQTQVFEQLLTSGALWMPSAHWDIQHHSPFASAKIRMVNEFDFATKSESPVAQRVKTGKKRTSWVSERQIGYQQFGVGTHRKSTMPTHAGSAITRKKHSDVKADHDTSSDCTLAAQP